MMHKRILLITLLTVGVALTTFGTVFALEGESPTPPPPCSGPDVAGTVVAVDETSGLVTIYSDEGQLCTVSLGDGTYDHPIVALLGQYFDDVNPTALQEALTYTAGCAIEDPDTGAWLWVDCDTVGAISVTVTGVGPGGVFTATATLSDTLVTNTLLISDTTTAGLVSDALQVLLVGWQLDEEGQVIEAGDRIAAYHEEGIGFGVLTKLFAIAQESQEACATEPGGEQADEDSVCGVSVDELVTMFRDEGMGMGQLFKEYGKPSMLGVGHIRKALKGQGEGLHRGGPKEGRGNGHQGNQGDLEGSEGAPGPNRGHGRPDNPGSNGNGNGNGHGRGHENGRGNKHDK